MVFVDQLAQRESVHKLHRDEMRAFVVADLINGGDVGMVPRCSSVRLWHKAAHAILIGRQLGRQNFQRHLAVQAGVISEIHLAHSTCADL